MGQKPGPSETPLMKQYWELKEQSQGALLFFRMGDFYELFSDDAVEASRILEITLTSRDRNKPDPMPMAGVPHHSAGSYIQRLLKAGKKVSIAEQMEDPSSTKGLVKREIVRTFTPAVQFDVEGAQSLFLAFAIPSSEKLGAWSLACLDPSTGHSLCGSVEDLHSLTSEIGRISIRHLLLFEGTAEKQLTESLGQREGLLIENLPKNWLSQEKAIETLLAHFEVASFESFASQGTEAAALGFLVHYVARAQKQDRLLHLRRPRALKQSDCLLYGPRTPQHLDLFPDAMGTPNLFDWMNHTRSSLGSRTLHRWLNEPLLEPQAISNRQNAVQEISSSKAISEGLKVSLKEVYDIERILGRVTTGLASPADTLALGKTLSAATKAARVLEQMQVQSPILKAQAKALAESLSNTRELEIQILSTQTDPAPISTKEGGIFQKGTSAELDRLIDLTENGQKWLVNLESRERERTGIPSLKVRYNRVFGYYIEITQAHLKNVPADYQRKQTMVGAERFFTEELKKFEEEILSSSSRQKALESDLFSSLLEKIRSLSSILGEIGALIGSLDALGSLSVLVSIPGWTFPKIDDSLEVKIQGGRHPLVDGTIKNGFVPNHLFFSPPIKTTAIITGPNMGGKSTIMRQLALIVILGQIGAPVPATQAQWGAFSSIHTRIGAHDAISRGHSTFMVEMSELAHILQNADSRSLIILDEIGRGTSTYDGMSVAWASLEWIATRIRARTLFATHYHELTRLSSQLPGVFNGHMAVEASGRGHLRFLYELREGPSSESFGIHVAQLAGLPKPLISRAWKILETLEEGGASTDPNTQLPLFSQTAPPDLFEEEPPEDPSQGRLPLEIVKRISETSIDTLTPLQALNFLAELKGLSGESEKSSGA